MYNGLVLWILAIVFLAFLVDASFLLFIAAFITALRASRRAKEARTTPASRPSRSFTALSVASAILFVASLSCLLIAVLNPPLFGRLIGLG